MPKIELKNIVDHEEKSRKLQTQLLMKFDDEIQSLPKQGFERLMCVSRYAAVFGRLWQFFTKQGLVMKEVVQSAGGEVEISEDVPIEKLQDLISIPVTPKRDKLLEGRAAFPVEIVAAQPEIRHIDIGTSPINVATPDEPEDDSPSEEEYSSDDEENS